MAQPLRKTNAKVGVSAEDLHERGVEYDGPGVAPRLPDYFGYLVGLVLLWLLYTGYSAFVSVTKEPISKISVAAEDIKASVKSSAKNFHEEINKDPALGPDASIEERAEILAQRVTSPEARRSWWQRLESVNETIGDAVASTTDYFDELLNGEPVVETRRAPTRKSKRSSSRKKELRPF